MTKIEYLEKTENNSKKNNNMPESKCRTKRIFHKLSKMAKKTKLFLKDHFPKRIWPIPRENRKGPKF